MPIYEYACTACGHQFEEWQKMSDPPVRVCPQCGQEKVERLISRTSFQLKGGGWYSDLYSSNKGGATTGAAASDSKGEAKAETKSESKPEAKAESKAEAKPAAKSEGGGSSTAAK